MKQPEYQGNGWALHNSDCIEGMHAMPEGSVDCAIFSPPFGDLFVYSDSERDLGNAGSGEAFTNQYRFFAEALTRVMRPGRIACVHCTDLADAQGARWGNRPARLFGRSNPIPYGCGPDLSWPRDDLERPCCGDAADKGAGLAAQNNLQR